MSAVEMEGNFAFDKNDDSCSEVKVSLIRCSMILLDLPYIL